MDAAVVLIFSSMFLSIAALEAHCPPLNCSNEVPDIHFPFWVSSAHHSQNFSHPSFQLSCKNSTTTIHFPSYGDLAVKSISYGERKLQLMDPKNCVHGVFLNLNLSLTPFKYYYVVKKYTYLNCSARLEPSFVEVPCLSGSRHHVYTVESSFSSVPACCRAVKTVGIPFSFSPYLADNSFGLAFTWSLPGFEDWKGKAHPSLEQNKGKGSNAGEMICVKFLKVVLCVLAVGMLVSIKIYHSKKIPLHLQKDNLIDVLNYKQ